MDMLYDNIQRRNIHWMQPNRDIKDKHDGKGKGKDTKDTMYAGVM